MAKNKILLTGGGGSMGGAGLEELLKAERDRKNEIVILDLPTKVNRKKLKPYETHPDVEIIWGDLTDYDRVLGAVKGVDYVLHAAAFIPPAADHDPDRAWRVNVGAAENLVRAIKSQPDPDRVKLVNIGSVAELGDRLPPVHVGRVGDPIAPSVFDMYGCAKAAAERIVAESGLKFWVSLRQTFILDPRVGPDPIMFHPPLNTCLEMCTLRGAGLVLANVVDDRLPGAFWRRFYNIGGGPGLRLTYHDFIRQTMARRGIRDLSDIFERRWFALRNFHCHWFEDAHILDDFLHHQGENFDDYLKQLDQNASFLEKLGASITPKSIIKHRVFAPLAEGTPDATNYWIEHDADLRIRAYYKNKETFFNIPDWGVDMPDEPDWYNYLRLDHGYDESKAEETLDLQDMQSAALFRGGTCLSARMKTGDLFTRLKWRCALGHYFEATPNLILKGGHWCPDCAAPPWNYDEQARFNPFLAQVWRHQHGGDEDNHYPEECVYDLLPTQK